MMPSAEKCFLAWSDFQENVVGTFCDLRDDQDFCDVTLVCEDNHQIFGHKVVLAASSQLLKAMLKGSPHKHPLLYFWGIKARDLASMVDFIYTGQVQLYQSDLPDFLNLAELLKVKGVGRREPREEYESNLPVPNGNIEIDRRKNHSYSEEPTRNVKYGENETMYPLKQEHISEELVEKDITKSKIIHERTTSQSDSPAVKEKKPGMTKPRTSSLWGFFTCKDGAEHVALCNICNKEISRGKAGISKPNKTKVAYNNGGMINHLHRRHLDAYTKYRDAGEKEQEDNDRKQDSKNKTGIFYKEGKIISIAST